MSQYADPSRTKQITVESNFRIDWHTLNIAKKDFQVLLGTKVGTKRDPVYDNNNVWVDTQPKDVIDFGGQDSTILKFEWKFLQDDYALLKKLYTKKDQESAQRIATLESEIFKLREERKSKSAAKLPKEPVMRPITDSTTVLEEARPTLYMHSPKGKKKKGNDTS